jgi:hypothetical protein
MLPWGHAALGYLFYTVFTRVRYRGPPVGLSVFALGLGTQLPDLVDKPLAWHLAVLPSGRSLAHSLFALALVVGGLWILFDDAGRRRLTAALGVGWGSHLVGDGYAAALNGDWAHLGYVFWPVTAYPAVREDRTIVSFLLNLDPTPRFWAGVGLAAVVACLWLFDGAPGVADVVLDRRRRDAEEDRA